VPRTLRTSDFDYDCPRELIAQRPLPDRGASRLLILRRGADRIDHGSFADFATLPDPGDVVVVNESRVIRARLIGVRDNGREAEVLLVHPEPDGDWLAMVHPGGKLKRGRVVRFGNECVAEIVDVVGGGLRKIRFSGTLSLDEVMQRFGKVPLPPYIEREPDAVDQDRYQTVYARADGSVAAPTAGLHFTPETLSRLSERQVAVVPVVLHVGPGTFKPVDTEHLTDHPMHAEW
jgi:S-adenosylmethionine:tRNA ribosyltransferase-isomerase